MPALNKKNFYLMTNNKSSYRYFFMIEEQNTLLPVDGDLLIHRRKERYVVLVVI